MPQLQLTQEQLLEIYNLLVHYRKTPSAAQKAIQSGRLADFIVEEDFYKGITWSAYDLQTPYGTFIVIYEQTRVVIKSSPIESFRNGNWIEPDSRSYVTSERLCIDGVSYNVFTPATKSIK